VGHASSQSPQNMHRLTSISYRSMTLRFFFLPRAGGAAGPADDRRNSPRRLSATSAASVFFRGNTRTSLTTVATWSSCFISGVMISKSVGLARTMMHCCGSVRRLIPRFIEMGLDVLDVVQVSTTGMDIRELHDAYGDRLNFAGSISVQFTLPFGTVEDVRREVELRLELFKDGGMILGPTHQIQAGTPLENILEMYRVAGSLAS